MHPVKDELTGLELLQLPEGFRYVSFGWTQDPLSDGRPTPWKTWLSCEESVAEHGSKQEDGKVLELAQKHGYIFEVPAQGITKPVPLKAMGRFVHKTQALARMESGCL
jgi:hypothetical protein